ncbi:succinate dehydrogenase cytochrome b560 subunit, mitochondrial-like [Rhopilema esculentum]|uniref:succinate dehydrogenase cytochrome b560 subunit, mitochondrial-like n=1 Tax=Rhopilema esculentum TaxID=499914 RepID=UPI0031D63F6C
MAALVLGRHLGRHIARTGGGASSKLWPVGLKSRPVTPMLAALASNTTAADRKMRPGEDFWKKNERMDRPVSPHVLIYKFELPGLLSGSHRVSGVIYSILTTGIAGFALVAPEHAPYYLDIIKSWNIPTPILFTLKGLLVWPFIYHSCNGIRHLFWDAAKGFNMPTLYKTGYSVLAVSTLLAAATAYYFTYA